MQVHGDRGRAQLLQPRSLGAAACPRGRRPLRPPAVRDGRDGGGRTDAARGLSAAGQRRALHVAAGRWGDAGHVPEPAELRLHEVGDV